jgi:hypothetical protein
MSDQQEEGVETHACPFVSNMVLQTVFIKLLCEIARSGSQPKVEQVPRSLLGACLKGACEIWDNDRARCSLATGSRLPPPPADVGG